MIGLFNLGGFDNMMGGSSTRMWNFDGASLGAGGLLFVLLAAAAIIFWLWMLMDCLKMPDSKFPAKGKNDKVIWTITILWLSLIGAILYWLMVKKEQ